MGVEAAFCVTRWHAVLRLWSLKGETGGFNVGYVFLAKHPRPMSGRAQLGGLPIRGC